MMKLWKRFGKNNKGFSLVELLCTIAIFSIIVTGVGTALVVSARSYSNGNVELDLQQQAQITANLLTNLIIDSDEVVQASGSTLILEKNESSGLVTYTVELNGDKIIYSTSNGMSGTLAENVIATTGFIVSQGEGGNVDFTLGFKEGTREYNSDYHVTPRNGITSGGAAMSGDASIFVENQLVLEPGQEYDLNVRVLGTSVQGFTVQNLSGQSDNTADTGTEVTVKDTNTVHIRVGLGETSERFNFDVKAADGSIAPQPVTVRVRRVNTINVNGYRTGGTVNRAGAEYKVTANLDGYNLPKELGSWFDVDYADPYTVDWSYEFTKEETDAYGNTTTTHPSVGSYIQETSRGVDSNNVPYVTFKLKQDMTEGCSLKVTATALHPEGKYPIGSDNKTNKSGLKYGTVEGSWVLEYQAWRRNGRLDIGLALDDSYFWTDSTPKRFKGNAELNIWGYSAYNVMVDHPTGFNFFSTTNSGSFVKVEPGYGDVNKWEMVLDLSRTSGDSMAYSSPYLTRYGDSTACWTDIVRYEVEIWYEVDPWQAPEHAGDGRVLLTSSHSIEDVQIYFRNAVSSSWNRVNKVYVTTLDTINDYNVYFMFDKGWEDTEEYAFYDLSRFVGVVHENDVDDRLDIRRDIPITGQYSDPAGNRYITFSLSSAEKEECKAISAGDGGIIKEIYEYNPYFGRLATSWDGSTIYYPTEVYTGRQVTPAELAAVKGCVGTVEFHFVDPNITGAALKAMYCPTLTEYGPLYYIDDTSRFSIQATTAQYQELVGGTWSTVVNLTWNGTNGWIAN